MIPYLLAYGGLAIIASFIAVTIGYKIELNRQQDAMIHWRNRAIDLQMDETERRLARVMRAKHARRCQIEQRRMG